MRVSRSTSEPASNRWWASTAGADWRSLDCSMAAATRRCRSSRRVRPRRARIAWPIRAWGTLRRPAPSSTSSPAATATSVASSRSSPSRPLASTRTGSVAALPATAARLRTWTTRGSRRSRRRPIIARIDSGSSSPTSPSVWRISSVRKNALPPVAACSSAAWASSWPVRRSSSATVSVPRASTPRRVSSPSRGSAAGDAIELRRRVVGRDADRRRAPSPVRAARGAARARSS